ncbi:MAG: AAA family ATPase [Pseudomonadota bacterium]|nr:AAA family ATPase [Pseudomonadota bacterium]
MQISRLRLLGFKSFVEPTELLIEPGLTGVVGPNGCGKSNLLEALRWVMGETSFKSMRGSAMEDVIFNGTQNRPARNMAEVTLFIDNTARKAPAEFNDSDVLEVSRRIEREVGSAYKVNGKDVRARDVRLLFEDAATGARSPALVRQGRIGEIVNAKPQDRRRVLEDAAGIAGLHSRRHEAELRLKAAEANMERLKDVTSQLTTQLNSLKRQARQARKYKELSEEIRKNEALLYHLQWTAACEQVQSSEEALQSSTRITADLTKAEAEALRGQTDVAETMQPLRDEEAVRAAVLQRLTVERDTLDQEEARNRERIEELQDRRAQLERDMEREQSSLEEASDTLARLTAEDEQLKVEDAERGDAGPRAKAEADARAQTLADSESTLSSLTDELAEARARQRQVEQTLQAEEARTARLNAQDAEIGSRLAALEGSIDGGADLASLEADAARLAEELAAAEAQLSRAEEEQANARAALDAARDAATAASLRAQELETETHTLIKLLRPAEDGGWRPVLEDVETRAGYELALGAALGDDLDAALDDAAPAHWSKTGGSGDDPALPEGIEALGNFVRAPEALGRRLAQVGLVERSRGAEFQSRLKTGQRLVSVEGDLWRWDGYSAAAEAPTASAVRLSEKNRLDGLRREASDARNAAAAAGTSFDAAKITSERADAALNELRGGLRQTKASVDAARSRLAAAERAAQESSKERGALAEARRRIAEGLQEAAALLAETRQATELLTSTEQLEARLDEQREIVAEHRLAYTEARAALDGVEREARQRRERLAVIAQDLGRWKQRRAGMETQIETLSERIEETREDLTSAEELPARIAERRNKLLSELAKAEEERSAAADRLAEAQALLRQKDAHLREVQGQLTEARETRARDEARLESARDRRSEQARNIRDQLDCEPDACLELAGYGPEDTLPALETVESRISGLRADREKLGGVNLRAEEESTEIAARLETMETEATDLVEAIARLRQGIASLNREGRKRLLEAFDEVNGHFQRLFKTLFGGGEAELQLVESEDPLESGLEILAQPPGKKPQVLSLLSGGEMALTAMALIFAVFLTNPSPICVLDEVDAPLDDTNVDRFCRMMDEMTRTTDTRFLIITHHPMTMARMSRLFGVTMSERGVSQLVSVDLETAERFREAG